MNESFLAEKYMRLQVDLIGCYYYLRYKMKKMLVCWWRIVSIAVILLSTNCGRSISSCSAVGTPVIETETVVHHDGDTNVGDWSNGKRQGEGQLK
jgi:hypothetical protein